MNGGTSWSELRPAGNVDQNWQAVACDASGVHILALVRNGRAYVSSDAGATWSELRPAGDATLPWKACAMDSDGSVMVAASYPSFASSVGRFYCSLDAGTIWTELRPVGDVSLNWQALAVNVDGSHIAAVVDGGSVWTSSDGGTTWTDARPAGVTASAWQCCASSADGSRLMAGAYQGRLYTGVSVATVSVTVTLTHGTLSGSVPTEIEAGGTLTVTVVPDPYYYVYSVTRGGVTAPLEPAGRNLGGVRTLSFANVTPGDAAITIGIFPRGDVAGDAGPDGSVDIWDASVLVGQFRMMGTGLLADLNCDEAVDVSDLSMLMTLWRP